MEISIDNIDGHQIKSYEPGKICIDETVYTESLILSQNDIQAMPACRTLEDINHAMLQKLIEQRFEIILIGSGEQTDFLAPELIGLCGQQGIGVECMPTRSACRTFNVLAAESRRVVAILII